MSSITLDKCWRQVVRGLAPLAAVYVDVYQKHEG